MRPPLSAAVGGAARGDVPVASGRIVELVQRREVLPAYGQATYFELELKQIQSHMAQKPVLRGEVGCACVAREVSVERGQGT